MELSSSTRNIEMTILSAENLRLNGRPLVKKDVFVVVKTDHLNSTSTGAGGAADQGGSNPNWNQKLELKMESHSPSISIQVHCRRTSINNTLLIGTASIPVSDFSGGYFPPNYLHLLSYRLRDSRGEKNGIINFSIKVKGGLADYVLPAAAPPLMIRKNTYSNCSSSDPKWGSPLPVVEGNNYYGSGGVVTGVPVWCA